MKLWIATVTVALATTVLLILGARHSTRADDFGLSGLGGASFVLASLAFATVGALGLVVHLLAGRAPIRLLGGLVYLVHARNTGAAFSIAEGQTVLLSSHVLREAALTVDDVVVVDRGRLVHAGPIGELQARHGALEDAFLDLTGGTLA